MKILETERLILRTFEETDIDAMTAINQDAKVCEYLPSIGSREETLDYGNAQKLYINKGYSPDGHALN